MRMWTYWRDKYYSRRDAVEALDPKLLSDPRVAMALTQIAVAEATLDHILLGLDDDDDDDDQKDAR